MPFFNLPKNIYYLPNYLPTYLPIHFLDNNSINDFNLGIKLTQSNGPISTNQIVNHFVSHSTSQNDEVQFNCPIMLDMAKTTCPD
jgi:hypothetical protein